MKFSSWAEGKKRNRGQVRRIKRKDMRVSSWAKGRKINRERRTEEQRRHEI